MITHRSNHFALVQGRATCWACHLQTPVAAVLLDEYQLRWEGGDDWEQGHGPAILTYITQINPEVLEVYKSRAPWMAMMPSRTAQESYWGNACTHCSALQGDWHLHEPDAPFFPTSPAHAAALFVTWYEVRLEAEARYTQSSWIDRLVVRCPHG